MCFRGILENTGGIATYISHDSDPCPFSAFISNHLSRRISSHKHNQRRRPDEEYAGILVTWVSGMVFCVLGWWECIGENDRPREIASRSLFVCRVDKDALHGVELVLDLVWCIRCCRTILEGDYLLIRHEMTLNIASA
jgi:hypothetical protein